MYSELRLKKLRGSGGYVMASVTDAQQIRGNLGGPDLFLAPIGRLNTEKITKYYCNTCDGEYGKPPKIDYVSPNEMVAENLILVERGKYICDTCNSTIAEYREFKKPDETAAVGIAKRDEAAAPRAAAAPAEPAVEAPAAPSVEAPVVEEAPAAAETFAPSVEAPVVEEAPAAPSVEPVEAPAAAETFAPSVEAPVVEEAPAAPSVEPVEAEAETAEEEVEEVEAQEDEPEEAAAEGITVIQDMEVYDHQARMVGSVAQVGVDQSLSPVLLIRSDDGEISVMPWSRISTIGHIILVEKEEAPAAPQAAPEPVAEPEPEPQKPGGCPACGASNAPDSKFCEECGNGLG